MSCYEEISMHKEIDVRQSERKKLCIDQTLAVQRYKSLKKTKLQNTDVDLNNNRAKKLKTAAAENVTAQVPIKLGKR